MSLAVEHCLRFDELQPDRARPDPNPSRTPEEANQSDPYQQVLMFAAFWVIAKYRSPSASIM